MNASARQFDLVLYGSTGFTGRLVAEYLARAYGNSIAWALAGRNQAGLEKVRAALAEIDPALASLELIGADSSKPDTLAALAAKTRVVCTTVGPYAASGLPLVAACAEAGTHYCDLTGEVQFVRRSIDGFHLRAEATGAKIVHSCGFDSVPSDLGVHALVRHFARANDTLQRARLYVCFPLQGGVSGGTIASGLGMMEEAKRDPSIRSLIRDPYSLSTHRSEERGSDGPDSFKVTRDASIDQWTAPFVMAPFNTRIVRRSKVLLGYGPKFSYDESIACGQGVLGFARATSIAAGIGALFASLAAPPLRPLVMRLLPAQGEGPSKAVQERSSFNIRILGESATGKRAEATVYGKGDPGYGATARMLGEAAVCLAKDSLDARAGVLTPASAMGDKLTERLRKRDFKFEVHDSKGE